MRKTKRHTLTQEKKLRALTFFLSDIAQCTFHSRQGRKVAGGVAEIFGLVAGNTETGTRQALGKQKTSFYFFTIFDVYFSDIFLGGNALYPPKKRPKKHLQKIVKKNKNYFS